MTIREDVRQYFEREAELNPAPPELRAVALEHARARADGRRGPQWIVGVIAALLALAIIGGLLATASIRHKNVAPIPANQTRLLFHDHLDGVVSGRPSLVAASGQLPIGGYELAANLPSTPSSGKVYEVDAKLAPSPKSVALAWGIKTPPHPDGFGGFSWDVGHGSLQYTPAQGTIDFNSELDYVVLAETISDETSAVKSASDLLIKLGLFSQGELLTMPVTVYHHTDDPSSGNPSSWTIQFARALNGVPVYDWQGPVVGVTILDAGGVQNLSFSRPPIAGGEPAALIDAASAWQQVALGHGYSIVGSGLGMVSSFRADKVELCYYDSGGPWIVPMWCFRDITTFGPDSPMWLFYPAMTPGTFDWTAPAGG